MKNKYLVANPMGVFLIRCSTMKQVKKFIKTHYDRHRYSLEFLYKRKVKMSEYEVRDLTEIPIYEECK
jgi:hypothetical protein